MRKTYFAKSSLVIRAALFILLTISLNEFAQAQTTTFAQFIQTNGTQDFVFTNAGTSATFNTIPNGSPVLFTYQNIANLPAELQGVQFARIFVTSSTTQPAFQTSSTPVRNIQQFNQTFTIRIIRDTPATPGNGGGSLRNLLTAVVTAPFGSNPSISGDNNSNSAAFTASTPEQTVTYSSDFIGFLATNSRNLGLSFSSINPLFTIGTGGFLNSFTAAGTGTFASNPVPIFNPPTAANVSISGRVLNESQIGVRRAAVTLTGSSGETQTVYTNNFGRFTFDEIAAGQIVTITISAKGYNYSPQVITLNESIENLDFIPQ